MTVTLSLRSLHYILSSPVYVSSDYVANLLTLIPLSLRVYSKVGDTGGGVESILMFLSALASKCSTSTAKVEFLSLSVVKTLSERQWMEEKRRKPIFEKLYVATISSYVDLYMKKRECRSRILSSDLTSPYAAFDGGGADEGKPNEEAMEALDIITKHLNPSIQSKKMGLQHWATLDALLATPGSSSDPSSLPTYLNLAEILSWCKGHLTTLPNPISNAASSNDNVDGTIPHALNCVTRIIQAGAFNGASGDSGEGVYGWLVTLLKTTTHPLLTPFSVKNRIFTALSKHAQIDTGDHEGVGETVKFVDVNAVVCGGHKTRREEIVAKLGEFLS